MGMTNTSFKFSCKGKYYVYRHPGPGTELIINRKSEFDSMKIAKELGLDDTYIYIWIRIVVGKFQNLSKM